MTKKIIKRNVKRGFSLIEIVVALGISIITMTGSAVLSAHLVTHAQENFLEESAVQLQNMITEQLKLLEFGLRNSVKANRLKCTNTLSCSSTGYLNMTDWGKICDINATVNFIINIPVFNNSVVNKVDVTELQGSNSIRRTNTDLNQSMLFYELSAIPTFGGFSNRTTPVFIHLEKVYSTTNGIDQVKFSTVISYDLFGKSYFTKLQEINMVRELICG